MSKVVLANQIHSVTIVDAFLSLVGYPRRSYVHPYKGYDLTGMDDQENIDMWKDAITLLPDRTARTNIMIRDKKGRFVSYRNTPELCETVESLKPFPAGDE